MITGSEPSVVRGAVGLRGNRWAGGALNDPACSPVSDEPRVPSCHVGVGRARALSASSLLLDGALGRALGSAGGSEQGGVLRATHGRTHPCPRQGRGPRRPRTGTSLERLSHLVHSAGRPPGCSPPPGRPTGRWVPSRRQEHHVSDHSSAPGRFPEAPGAPGFGFSSWFCSSVCGLGGGGALHSPLLLSPTLPPRLPCDPLSPAPSPQVSTVR